MKAVQPTKMSSASSSRTSVAAPGCIGRRATPSRRNPRPPFSSRRARIRNFPLPSSSLTLPSSRSMRSQRSNQQGFGSALDDEFPLIASRDEHGGAAALEIEWQVGQ